MIRRQFLRNSLGTVAAAAGIHTLSSCGGTKSTGGRGQITLGSYADPALDILKDVLLPEFEKATGIRTEWVEADFSGWLQKSLNDGQTKAGAFDIYVMDDLWVPRFAGAGYLANLGELGFQTDEDFLPSALDLVTGRRRPDCASRGLMSERSLLCIHSHLSAMYSSCSIAMTFTAAGLLPRGTMFCEWRGKRAIRVTGSTDGLLAESREIRL